MHCCTVRTWLLWCSDSQADVDLSVPIAAETTRVSSGRRVQVGALTFHICAWQATLVGASQAASKAHRALERSRAKIEHNRSNFILASFFLFSQATNRVQTECADASSSCLAAQSHSTGEINPKRRKTHAIGIVAKCSPSSPL